MNQENYAPYELQTIIYILEKNDLTAGQRVNLSLNRCTFIPDEIEVQGQLTYWENPSINQNISVALESTNFYNTSPTFLYALWPTNTLSPKFIYSNPGRLKISTFDVLPDFTAELPIGGGAIISLFITLTLKRYRYPPPSAVLIEMAKNDLIERNKNADKQKREPTKQLV